MNLLKSGFRNPFGDRPAILTLADIDFYKFTMGQFIWTFYPTVRVKFAFKNRSSKVPLAKVVNEAELREELNHVKGLRFDQTTLNYLRGLTKAKGVRLFDDGYLNFLRELRMPDYSLEFKHDEIILSFEALWCEVTYWETIALSIINELVNRSTLRLTGNFERSAIVAEAITRLEHKIGELRNRPFIIFSDFGTRRRFSAGWQDFVVGSLTENLSRDSFTGTSSLHLAMKHGITPIGTNAHELPMVVAALKGAHGNDADLLSAQEFVLDNWWRLYGEHLSIFLPDTFGTEWFLNTLSAERAHQWKGFRQDSGDPFVEGEQWIKGYEKLGVDPKTKLMVPSDGLDLPTIFKLKSHFDGRINMNFGWGTTLTNDTRLGTLSLVVKAVSANGIPTVKLSNNRAKAMGPIDEVQRYERVFGYRGGFEKEPTV